MFFWERCKIKNKIKMKLLSAFSKSNNFSSTLLLQDILWCPFLDILLWIYRLKTFLEIIFVHLLHFLAKLLSLIWYLLRTYHNLTVFIISKKVVHKSSCYPVRANGSILDLEFWNLNKEKIKIYRKLWIYWISMLDLEQW